MKFVTKAEFENALSVIQRALESGQVQHGHYADERKTVMESLYFSDGHDLQVKANSVTLLNPQQAAKNRLFFLAERKGAYTANAEEFKKLVEEVEKEQKELAALLTTLKE